MSNNKKEARMQGEVRPIEAGEPQRPEWKTEFIVDREKNSVSIVVDNVEVAVLRSTEVAVTVAPKA